MSQEQPHPVTAAIRKRAPDTNLDNWFWALAAETGCSHSSIKGWIAGERVPDRDSLERLTRHFGLDFHHEITNTLYGWHVSEAPDDLKARLERLEAHHAAMGAEFHGSNVTRIKEKVS